MSDPFERRPWRAFPTSEADVAATVAGWRQRHRRRNEALLAATAGLVVLAGLAAAVARGPAGGPIGLTTTGSPSPGSTPSTSSPLPSLPAALPSAAASLLPSFAPEPSPTPSASATYGRGDSTGVSGDNLRVGVHLPLLGSGPFPFGYLADAARDYWAGRTVFGRSVQLEIVDDGGRDAPCDQLAARNLLVAGWSVPEAVDSCAAKQAMQAIPYLTPGVGLDGTSHDAYFAVTATPLERAGAIRRLLALSDTRAGSWAIVAPSTEDGIARSKAIADALDTRMHAVFPTSKAPSDSEAAALAGDLKRYGAPSVAFVGTPSFFVKLVAQAHAQLYDPQWVLTENSADGTAQTVCAATNNNFDGRVLSDVRALRDPPAGFANPTDELAVVVWGLMESLHQVLLTTNGDLRRSTLLDELERANLTNGTFPPVLFGPDDHFGAVEVFLLRSDCAARRWATGQRLPLR